MNILRLSTLSLTLAIVVMTLGYVNPASAGKPVKNCDPDEGPVHASCKDDGGGGGDDSLQVIGVVDDDNVSDPQAPLWAPTSESPVCLMQKGPGKSMSGAFPRHDLCATLYTEISGVIVPTLHDDIIVVVAADNHGVVQTVQVQGQDFIGSIGIVHISDLMVPSSVDNNPDGSMVIHVHSDDVQMNKCDTHVLKQKSVCTIDAGLFAIDDLLYTTEP